MKKQLHFYLVAIMLTLGFNVDAQNLIDDAFYGFEVRNDGNDFEADNDAGTLRKWGTKISTVTSDANFIIDTEKSVSGDNSLKYDIQATEQTDAIYTAKDEVYLGSSTLTAITGGDYYISCKFFVDGTVDSGTFQLRINDGGNINILTLTWSDLESNKWVEVNNTVDLPDLSGIEIANIQVRMVKVSGSGSIYLDDIAIQKTQMVTFYATDEAGNPLSSVNATFLEETFSTPNPNNEDGTNNGLVTIPMVYGDHTVVFTKNGYEMVYENIVVPVGGQYDLEMQSGAQTAQIVVNASDDDGVLGGAMVIAKDINDIAVFAKATAVNNGRAWVSGLEAGTYTYEIRGNTTLTGTAEFTGKNRNLSVQEGVYNLNFVTIDSDTNNDIGNATLIVKDNSGNEVFNQTNDGTTSADAEFVYQGDIAGGPFTYTANADGYDQTTAVFEVNDINNIDITYIKLKPIATGIDTPNDFVYSVYPNPASSVLNVVSPLGSTITLYSVSGNKVKVITNSAGVTPIMVNDLAKGLYIVEIVNKSAKVIEKVQLR